MPKKYLGIDYIGYLKNIGIISGKRSGPILSFILIVGFIVHFVVLSDNYINLNHSLYYWIWNLQPPIVEEILFRGVILSILLMSFSRLNAMLISSFLFSLIHILLDPVNVLIAFIVGVIFVILVFQTGSILPVVVIHYIINSYFQGIWMVITTLILFELYFLGKQLIKNKNINRMHIPN
ncbi:CPBP family intramembrane glutamic endopeptidase [Caldalkalibacillus mannanilyticus]|uniref:CPBP family intramembrane glutamic endopeptidase n=1 Tax=Caldalkalibacillus mannanilyticus TaxID=1418 RepID=UPI00131EDCD6